MTEAKTGDVVRVHYTGKLDDGSQFDSSVGGEPLEFTVGAHEVIPGFETMVTGMSPGATKTEKIPCAQAYGPRQDDQVFRIPRDIFPVDLNPKPGQRLSMSHPAGGSMPVTVVEVGPEIVILDANHPLAGKDLTFEIQLVAIVSS